MAGQEYTQIQIPNVRKDKMHTIEDSPVFEAVTRTGKNKYWQGSVVEDNGKFYTRTSYWQDTADGQSVVQFSEPKFSKPTNVGRSNERDNREQASFDLTSLISKQRDKGYSEQGMKRVETLPTPMLANKWDAKKHLATYPFFAQPKFDGVRLLFDGTRGWSRMGKLFIPEVIEHLKMNTGGLILDGELIYEGATFQSTIRAVKKYRETSQYLTYNVFDIVMPDTPFEKRYQILKEFFRNSTIPSNVRMVPALKMINLESLMYHHNQFTAEGYEGTIIRIPNGEYQIGQRFNDLLKLKDFVDAEFKIVDVTEGAARELGAAIFICTTENGKYFNVRPKGSIEARKEIWANPSSYIDKMLTVRYQGFSEDGIPRFPVGLSIRDVNVQG